MRWICCVRGLIAVTVTVTVTVGALRAANPMLGYHWRQAAVRIYMHLAKVKRKKTKKEQKYFGLLMKWMHVSNGRRQQDEYGDIPNQIELFSQTPAVAKKSCA